mmetsp:Transcript_8237/g.30380  ORF Transcript_8237/g.30380 Transcript_8237/m.30380 type:complete len:470 (+) Transcript_8237:309-1718(+)|eukprot:scaffold569_cov408-Prasinococcus_capsulatus_cf.AAC.16
MLQSSQLTHNRDQPREKKESLFGRLSRRAKSKIMREEKRHESLVDDVEGVSDAVRVTEDGGVVDVEHSSTQPGRSMSLPTLLTSKAKSVVSTVIQTKKELTAEEIEEIERSAQQEIQQQDRNATVADPKYAKIFKIKQVFQRIRNLQEKATMWDVHVQSVVSTQDALCAGAEEVMQKAAESISVSTASYLGKLTKVTQMREGLQTVIMSQVLEPIEKIRTASEVFKLQEMLKADSESKLENTLTEITMVHDTYVALLHASTETFFKLQAKFNAHMASLLAINVLQEAGRRVQPAHSEDPREPEDGWDADFQSAPTPRIDDDVNEQGDHIQVAVMIATVDQSDTVAVTLTVEGTEDDSQPEPVATEVTQQSRGGELGSTIPSDSAQPEQSSTIESEVGDGKGEHTGAQTADENGTITEGPPLPEERHESGLSPPTEDTSVPSAEKDVPSSSIEENNTTPPGDTVTVEEPV